MQPVRFLVAVVTVAALVWAAVVPMPLASAGERGQPADVTAVAMAPDGNMADCAACEPSGLGTASPICAPACPAAAAILPVSPSGSRLPIVTDQPWSTLVRLAGTDARPEPHPPKVPRRA